MTKITLTLEEIKQNPYIEQFIKETDKKLNACGYTDHGKHHAKIVSDRAMKIARKLNFSENEIEYCGIAGYCHDMGNFLGRDLHHHWGSMLFHQVFSPITDDIVGITAIMQAISNHDKNKASLTNRISAVLIIADKSDVHRDRVVETDEGKINGDIHDRVNQAVYENHLSIDPQQKIITLSIKLDTKITAIMDYFEIFVERMNYCRISAKYLEYKFSLAINEFVLL